MSDPETPVPSPSAQPAPQIIYVQAPAAPQKKRVNHGLHLFLSIITAGLWLPVWLILAIAA